KQVRIGVSPQLTLEAAILRGGGFRDIPADASVAELVYVSLKGGDPAGDGGPIDFKDGDANAHADRALAKLKAVATRFEDEQQPYLPLVLSMWKSRYGTYDHLARGKEWSVRGREDAESGECPPLAPFARSLRICGARRSRPRTPRFPLGSRPMPARARPTCWRNA